MEITPELLRKHKDYLLEVTVKSHQRTSKKGKIYTVKQFERAQAEYDAMDVERKQISLQIDKIVQSGGVVGLGDPLSRRFAELKGKQLKLKKQLGSKFKKNPRS